MHALASTNAVPGDRVRGPARWIKLVAAPLARCWLQPLCVYTAKPITFTSYLLTIHDMKGSISSPMRKLQGSWSIERLCHMHLSKCFMYLYLTSLIAIKRYQIHGKELVS